MKWCVFFCCKQNRKTKYFWDLETKWIDNFFGLCDISLIPIQIQTQHIKILWKKCEPTLSMSKYRKTHHSTVHHLNISDFYIINVYVKFVLLLLGYFFLFFFVFTISHNHSIQNVYYSSHTRTLQFLFTYTYILSFMLWYFINVHLTWFQFSTLCRFGFYYEICNMTWHLHFVTTCKYGNRLSSKLYILHFEFEENFNLLWSYNTLYWIPMWMCALILYCDMSNKHSFKFRYKYKHLIWHIDLYVIELNR